MSEGMKWAVLFFVVGVGVGGILEMLVDIAMYRATGVVKTLDARVWRARLDKELVVSFLGGEDVRGSAMYFVGFVDQDGRRGKGFLTVDWKGERPPVRDQEVAVRLRHYRHKILPVERWTVDQVILKVAPTT